MKPLSHQRSTSQTKDHFLGTTTEKGIKKQKKDSFETEVVRITNRKHISKIYQIIQRLPLGIEINTTTKQDYKP
jgi:hypothetical protein